MTTEDDLLYLGTNDGLRLYRRDDEDGEWMLAAQALDNAPVTALQPAPDGSGDLLCAVGAWGMWRCDAEGRKAREINRGITNRELHALAVSSDGAAVFAGAAPPEVYRSEDGGESWAALASFTEIPSSSGWFYPVPPNYANIRQIVCHPTEPRTLYVGVEVGGLFRSTDGGGSWEDLTGDMNPDCHAVALHPARPGRILVATPKGPYVSRDGGRTWKECWEGRSPAYSASIAVCPSQPEVAVAGISRGFRGGEASIWRTEDGGETWRRADGDFARLAPSQVRGALAYSRSRPETALAGTLAGDVYESRDAGRSWTLSLRGAPPVRCLYKP